MKLMTKELERKLKNRTLGSQDGKGDDLEFIAKFFVPWSNWTWYVAEGEQTDDGDWEFFGCTVGQYVELGYFRLSDLESVRHRLFGIGIERDRYFSPCKLRDIVDDKGMAV